MNANPSCVDCCRRKALGFIENSDLCQEKKDLAMEETENLLKKCKDRSAPELMASMLAMIGTHTGIQDLYEEPKRLYNQLLLTKEADVFAQIQSAPDPFLAGIQFAVTGNYIDFAGVSDVREDKLNELLERHGEIQLSKEELKFLTSDLAAAKRLLYIADNAGEIVLDKLFIRILKELYPRLEIAVLVRELPILNDATKEDARSIGMDREVPILTNGTGVPGTVIRRLPKEAAAWLESADLCIAKGQGNFESLHGCGRNVYFLLLCKCSFFTEAFGVPQYTPVLCNERRLSLRF